MYALLAGFVPLLLLDAGLILLICLMLGWFGAKPLRALAEGIDRLAKGEPVQLQQKGATAELAKKLNEAGMHLQKQARLIAQRDAARTSWIAGVSHDLRTPLTLIMGYAEQMEAAGRLRMPMDDGLLQRALENLLCNSVRMAEACALTTQEAPERKSACPSPAMREAGRATASGQPASLDFARLIRYNEHIGRCDAWRIKKRSHSPPG